ncbi:flagellar basal body rod protein FlgC [Thioclava atlantica]|uniref:Flagellar basal-body rod protein FlgC n=1 Tax=Thioclava atlantica TaxID=1317124 RepID=A0A085TY74_9RHOB|nr:flagellar basal body rod protein FlgC [Thioclava atlantica]KFE35671.1 protein FlgC [Thioclava atlantica]
MDPLKSIGEIAASGLRAQGERLKVVSENVANADSTGSTPGADPYRRKTISFGEMVDDATGATMVDVAEIGRDTSDFVLKYDPSHPAANAEGFVKMPNVNPIIEMSNMREAARSYEANLNMLETGRQMRREMIDLLK